MASKEMQIPHADVKQNEQETSNGVAFVENPDKTQVPVTSTQQPNNLDSQ